ncbi:ROK family transcriptional regulator [Streptomyces sp. B-S-A8]|uniref:ROK family transcriptional regulator n=1 Tax=Streptomyces solicavernae TaxID=3043614 RepID=A0ABT6RU59_9ACTN|nr:ROK family transcriptional regulator [Streptomyces sp. B-S-A8]MDI3387972.1 ROK family transcriptional regulator [Streptomyces sp. B-S-A8]
MSSSAATPNWRPLSPGERAVAIAILTHGPLSRSELAKRLDLSAGSLTRLTKPLIESGLLVDAGSGPEEPAPAPSAVTGATGATGATGTTGASGGVTARQGRPTRPLDIVAGAQHFAGFKVTADAVYGVVTTLRSEVVARRLAAVGNRDPEAVVDQIAVMAREFKEEFPRLAGAGIGVGGQVRDRSLVVENAFLDWEEVPLAAMVEERIALPVVVDNDGAALIEAEAWFGAGRGLDRFAVLTIGAGFGYGLVLDGKLVRTRESGKRWIIDPYGPFDRNGERGTAEGLLTIPAICSQIQAATGDERTYAEILDAAAAGEPLPHRIVHQSARALGTLVAQIANHAIPEKILLAGEGVGLVDVAGGTVREAIDANRHPSADPVVLETKVSDFHEWARGAAVLAIQVLVLGARKDRGDVPQR